ncbi:hypothetical protein [Ferrovum myxofaciens]|uniref:Uncharacterized protein n=1 Tax=Ferrovum myxofaciens TaxID=416213 RepID=A0A9E6MZ75_9PROT|nr:hypothetical protein [Ferrovum myxofaciens]QKE37419.1 MAG: hypothetical protein HO273_00630 [Ferrovum myxofaciens]QWY75067.1 MAG: hypothetical protein JVY19_01055 [Ferrovum myxofaciens]QWY77802.1 MAG: hypothetical protein JZL65_01560 [Ferrovum myxofaciens]
MEKKKNYDYTATKRNASLKKRLVETGGVRMSLNLDGQRVNKIDALIKNGRAETRSEMIRLLIDEAEDL